MKGFLTAIGLISLIMCPVYSEADTILLKNGRKIEAARCWEDGDLIRCKIHGQTIGYPKRDITEIKMDSAPEAPVNGFRFDIWQSGISVHEAIDIAEANDLPLHKDGLLSVNKKFNPKMCRPYADTATRFYYNGRIFNKWARLTLSFTLVSKKLYCVEIRFNNTGMSRDSEFREQVEAMLQEKYGKPLKVSHHVGVYKTYDWQINENAIVTMRPGVNFVNVSYLDKTIAKAAQYESKEQIRDGFTKNDKSKF
jgi:hypothetical protein